MMKFMEYRDIAGNHGTQRIPRHSQRKKKSSGFPEIPSGRRNSQLTAKKIPGDAYNAPDDWISYMDAETQQEYWYNTKTGETSWER